MALERNPIRIHRKGIATLWTILTLCLLVLMVCYVVEAGRLFLARQQLVISLESAAMAAAKDWCRTSPDDGTLEPRQVAIDFAAANPVLGQPVILDTNFGPGNLPNENASCGGDLIFGALSKESPEVVFDTSQRAGCGLKDGPNAVALDRVSDGDWETVTLCGRNYECMIVVGTPNYDASTPPSVVRIRNAGGGSFEYFVQNVNTGAPVAGIPVNFIVVEAGVYTDADGIQMEAAKYESTVTDRKGSYVAENQPYAQAYANPIVVGQVMTFNDPDWSVFWSFGGGNRATPAGANLFTGKHVGEDADTTRADETVGYIVFEAGSGHINGLPVFAGQTPDAVQATGNSGGFNATIPSGDPCRYAVASQTGEAGGDGGFALLLGPNPVSAGGVNLVLDEDQLRDNERNHTTEVVNYVTFGGPCVVRARATIEVPWLCDNFLGCELPSTTLTAEVTAYHDCDDDCPKILCVDQFICP